MKAIFERKPSEFNLQEVEIEKTLRLSAELFAAVLESPLHNYDFVKEYTDLMYCDREGKYHCILLTGEGRNDGLLVEAEGASYCRYASYVPDVTAIMMAGNCPICEKWVTPEDETPFQALEIKM